MIHEGEYLVCPMTGAWKTHVRGIDHARRVLGIRCALFGGHV
jgi:hypothetical protein